MNTRIALGEWLPDQPDLGNPGVTVATNVFPTALGYRPVPVRSAYGSALPAACIGAVSARADDASAYTYAGTATGLYRLSTSASPSWVNVSTQISGATLSITAATDTIADSGSGLGIFSAGDTIVISGSTATPTNNGTFTVKTAGAASIVTTENLPTNESANAALTVTRSYGLSTDERWEFVRWKNVLYSFALSVYPQALASISAGTFTALTTAVRAATACVARDFLLVGNTYDGSDGHVPYRIRWSAINDPTSWTVSASTQADYTDLPGSAGWVRRVVGGESPLVVCEKSVFRMVYTGAPDVWELDEIEPALGTPSSGSVVQAGDTVFMLSWDGFVAISATGVTRIGAEKVDRWFFANADSRAIATMIGVADLEARMVIWAFSRVAATPDTWLVFEWATGRWSLVEENTEAMFAFAAPPITLDDLPSLGYTNIDSIPFSLDSRIWTDGLITLGSFDDTHALVLRSTTNKTALIETAEVNLAPGRRSLVRDTRPLVDGGTQTVAVGTRNRQEDGVTWGDPVATDEDGTSAQRADARFHRFRIEPSGAWTRAHGLEVDFQPTGAR